MKILVGFFALSIASLSFSNANIKFFERKLGNGSLLLTSTANNSTNIGILEVGNKVILIDPSPGKDRLQELEEIICKFYEISDLHILNTHGHSDHSGGNDYFLALGATINEADFSSLETYPVISHSSSDKIFYHIESNIIFTGDVFSTNWHPTFYAGGVDGFVHAIDTILKVGRKNSLVIPGHGEPAGKDVVKAYKESTLRWIERVGVLQKAGKTVDEMLLDRKLQRILRSFNFTNRPQFLPRSAEVRFVERTITILEPAGDS
ncbi:MBL fold metallo-hydrolase [Microbulbifer sp. TYP-18]|uniref:MBL fold metallo-hydrolase n=1 Tax=Microbulbifer sp. TYP-18 TaxID=3230024 RepID=UPI0034C63C1C